MIDGRHHKLAAVVTEHKGGFRNPPDELEPGLLANTFDPGAERVEIKLPHALKLLAAPLTAQRECLNKD